MKKAGRVKKTKRVNRWLYWTPRILSMLFLLFLAMFSLDVFDSSSSVTDIILGLLMHNIPVFVLLIVLIIAWKYEWLGAVVFILAGIAYMILTALRMPWYIVISWSLVIAGPAFLIGILFWINWIKKK